jgi:hypothetical protein
MPKVYTRKYQREIHDLYNILLFCDVSTAGISSERHDELLDWLWERMGPYHKKWGTGPHTTKKTKSEPLPKSVQLILRYEGLKSKYAHEKALAEKAKHVLMKEGWEKEALEKALYRARKKHLRKIDSHDIPLRQKIDSDDIPF